MKKSNTKVYRAISIFCLIGTLVMIIPNEDGDIILGGVIFYAILFIIFNRLHKKSRLKDTIDNTSIDIFNKTDDVFNMTNIKKIYDKAENKYKSAVPYASNKEEEKDIEVEYENPFYRSASQRNKIYVKTILLEQYKKAGYIYQSNSQYPEYLVNGLGIVDMYKVYYDFIKDGYIEVASDYDVLLTLLKPQLENICVELGIPKSGNKPDLVDRIINTENFKSITIPITGSAEMFIISPKGKKWIDDNSDLLLLRNMPHIDIDRYLEIKQSLIDSNINPVFEQIIIIILKEHIDYYISNHDYRNIIFVNKQIIDLYIKLDNSSDSLSHLIYSFFINMSGLSSFGRLESIHESTINLREYYRLSQYDLDRIKTEADNIISKLDLPFSRFSYDILLSMLLEFSSTNDININKYLRFKKEAPIKTEWGEYWANPISRF